MENPAIDNLFTTVGVFSADVNAAPNRFGAEGTGSEPDDEYLLRTFDWQHSGRVLVLLAPPAHPS